MTEIRKRRDRYKWRFKTYENGSRRFSSVCAVSEAAARGNAAVSLDWRSRKQGREPPVEWELALLSKTLVPWETWRTKRD